GRRQAQQWDGCWLWRGSVPKHKSARAAGAAGCYGSHSPSRSQVAPLEDHHPDGDKGDGEPHQQREVPPVDTLDEYGIAGIVRPRGDIPYPAGQIGDGLERVQEVGDDGQPGGDADGEPLRALHPGQAECERPKNSVMAKIVSIPSSSRPASSATSTMAPPISMPT